MIPVLNLSGGGLAQAVHLSSSPQESLKSRDFAVYISDTQSTVCKSSKRVYQDDWTSSLKSSYKTTFKLFILRSKCLLNACSTNVSIFFILMALQRKGIHCILCLISFGHQYFIFLHNRTTEVYSLNDFL